MKHLCDSNVFLPLDRLMEDDATGFESEPPGLDPVWRQLSDLASASPKR